MLTATDQKVQKSLKRWYYPPSQCLNVSEILSNSSFSILKIAAVCHIHKVTVTSFWSISMPAVFCRHLVGKTLRNVCRLHLRTKFRKDRSNHCRDTVIFCDVQDGARRHVGFSEIWNFNGRSTVSHHTKFLQNQSNGCRYMTFNGFFQTGSRPPS